MIKVTNINLSIVRWHALCSDVARVPCSLGQKYFCAPANKTAEFKVKNRIKSAEEANSEHLLL